MSERYKTIHRIQKEFIGSDCPVSLLAHAILLDTLENKKLVQLKLCNCSNKVVRSVKVSIKAFDQNRTPIEEIDTYEFSSLNVAPGSIFGSQSPIYFSRIEVIAYIEILIREVLFADGELWKAAYEEPLKERPEQKELTAVFSGDLYDQYKELINDKAEYVPVEISNNLWSCSCGTLNAAGNTCRLCGVEKRIVFDNFNANKLRDIVIEKTYQKACALSNAKDSEKKSVSELTSALELFSKIPNYKDSSEKVAELKSLLPILTEKENKLRRKKMIWGICLGSITVLVVLLLVLYIIPQRTDAKRSQIIDSALSNTIIDTNALSEIPEDYYKKHIDKAYACGEKLIKSRQWNEAEKYFSYCGAYESSREYSKYIAAQKAIGDNNNADAISNLESILGFLDADELLGDEYLKHINAEKTMSLSDAIDLLSKPSSLSSEAEAYFTLLQSLSRAEGSFKGSHRYQFDGKNFIDYSAPDLAYTGDLSVFIYLNYGVAKADVYTKLLPYAHDYKKDCNVVRKDDQFYQNDLVVEIPSGNSYDYIWLQNYRVIYVDHDNTLTYFNRSE